MKYINKKIKLNLLYYVSMVLLFVTVLTACDVFNKRQLPGRYISDVMLTAKIKFNIFTEKGIDSSDIHIESYNSTVQIAGFVRDKWTYDVVVSIVRNTEGVKQIINNLVIKN